MTDRNGFGRCQNGHGDNHARKSVDDTCLRSTRQPVYSGMISSQASIRNEGTWLGVSREIRKWHTPRGRRDRGGAARSSAEVAVMAIERRGCVTLSDIGRQPALSGGASCRRTNRCQSPSVWSGRPTSWWQGMEKRRASMVRAWINLRKTSGTTFTSSGIAWRREAISHQR